MSRGGWQDGAQLSNRSGTCSTYGNVRRHARTDTARPGKSWIRATRHVIRAGGAR